MTPDILTPEEHMQLTIGHGHVLYTRGEDGTDALAEDAAKNYGMQIKVVVPPNHPRAKFTSPASVEELMQTTHTIGAAAHHLCRRVPTHFYALSLLQRNCHLVRKAHTLFAFGQLNADGKTVAGGTGWTVQFALDQGKDVVLFDTHTHAWYRSNITGRFENARYHKVTSFQPWGTQKPPTLHQSSAVIGSRDIDPTTQEEIKHLFERTFCLPDNLDQVKRELIGLQA